MSSKFKVIESTNEDKLQEMDCISKIAQINEIWERYFFDMVMRYTEEYGTLYKLPQDKLAKSDLLVSNIFVRVVMFQERI